MFYMSNLDDDALKPLKFASYTLNGDLDICFSIFDAGERRVAICKEALGLLRVVFRRLGHNVRIYFTSATDSRVRSDSMDIQERRDIEHIANVTMMAFYDADYDPDVAMGFLEELKLVPPLMTLDDLDT